MTELIAAIQSTQIIDGEINAAIRRAKTNVAKMSLSKAKESVSLALLHLADALKVEVSND